MNILVVAAHPDDEVLGCGGTLAHWAEKGHDIHILQIADGEGSRSSVTPDPYLLEQRLSAAKKAGDTLGCSSVESLNLPDNQLDTLPLLDLVRQIETFILRIAPRIVLTHHCGDVNIDHRLVHEAVVTACRPQPNHPVHELWFFEVASSTEWRPAGTFTPFIPNIFVDISTTLPQKLAALGAYASELRDYPHPRSIKATEALAHWRGASAGLVAAEAFILGRKIIGNHTSDTQK